MGSCCRVNRRPQFLVVSIVEKNEQVLILPQSESRKTSVTLYEKGMAAIEKGDVAVECKKYKDALLHYHLGLEYLCAVAKTAKTPEERGLARTVFDTTMENALTIKEYLNANKPPRETDDMDERLRELAR